MEAGATPSQIVGITGAPCTGKTSLAGWLQRKLSGLGVDCELLSEPARLLAERGVRIDREMREPDYDAFLQGYADRDLRASAALAIADRTPADHYSYIEANRNVPRRFRRRHHDAARSAMQRYQLVLYLPVELPMRDDRFRETSRTYQRRLDEAIVGLLGECTLPIVTIRGSRSVRRRAALAAIEVVCPDLLGRSAAQAGAAE